MKRRGHIVVDSLLCVVAAAAIVGAGSLAVEARRDISAAETLAQLKRTHPNAVAERAYAERYWSRHRDVRASPLYGSQGPLGVYGPRAHYIRFGRSEGRLWPETRGRGKPD